MTQKIVAFDILGPMYYYGMDGWANGALKTLTDKLREHGYTGKTSEEEARDEADMLLSGKEVPNITPGFVETVLYIHEQGDAFPIIVSAGASDSSSITGITVSSSLIITSISGRIR